MRLQADAVAGAVDEVLAVAGRGDEVARGGVDRLGGHAGPDGAHGGVLGLRAAPRSTSTKSGGRLADDVGAGRSRSSSRSAWCRRCRPRPGRRARSPGRDLVVRAGAVGPGADDDEVDRARGPRRRSPRRCRGRPRARCGPAAATRPSGRARGRSPRRPRAARRPRPGVLRIRSSRSTAAGEACSAPGSAARKRQHLLGPHAVGQPDRADRPSRRGRPARTGRRSRPSRRSRCRAPADRRGLRGRPLQAGHDQRRLAVGRQHQAGEPLQRQRVVAGQVAQVRPGGEAAARPGRPPAAALRARASRSDEVACVVIAVTVGGLLRRQRIARRRTRAAQVHQPLPDR